MKEAIQGNNSSKNGKDENYQSCQEENYIEYQK